MLLICQNTTMWIYRVWISIIITFYVQKPMAPLAVCSGLPLVRDGQLGAPTFVRFAFRGSSCMSLTS